MVGEAAGVKPVAPVLGRHLEALDSLFEAVWTVELARPAERAVAAITLDEAVAGPRRPAFEPEPQVADQPQRPPGAGCIERLRVTGHRRPRAGDAPVIEQRLADQLDLDRPVDALDRAHQRVVGVVVGRWACVRGGRAHLALAPVSDDQRVADHRPAGGCLPRRLEHVRARVVAAACGHAHPGGAEPEAAGATVENRREDARRIEARWT